MRRPRLKSLANNLNQNKFFPFMSFSEWHIATQILLRCTVYCVHCTLKLYILRVYFMIIVLEIIISFSEWMHVLRAKEKESESESESEKALIKIHWFNGICDIISSSWYRFGPAIMWNKTCAHVVRLLLFILLNLYFLVSWLVFFSQTGEPDEDKCLLQGINSNNFGPRIRVCVCVSKYIK